MSKKERDGNVKKETMLVVAFIALALGFLGGVFYSAFKTGPAREGPLQERPQVSTEQISEISELEKETAFHPDNVEAWVRLGNLYFDADRVDSAINAYQRSLALVPGNADVLTDLGVMYRRKGRPEDAIKSFDRAIEVNPRQEAAYFNKGVVFMHDLNNPDEAVKAWEELLKVNPTAKVQSGETILELIEKIKGKKP